MYTQDYTIANQNNGISAQNQSAWANPILNAIKNWVYPTGTYNYCFKFFY